MATKQDKPAYKVEQYQLKATDPLDLVASGVVDYCAEDAVMGWRFFSSSTKGAEALRAAYKAKPKEKK